MSLDSANTNTQHDKIFGIFTLKKVCVCVYLRFKFYSVSSVFSDNPMKQTTPLINHSAIIPKAEIWANPWAECFGRPSKGSVLATAVLDSFFLFFLVGAMVLDPRDLAFTNEAT